MELGDQSTNTNTNTNTNTQVIAAEGEQKASKALKEAADVLQQSPSALQVARDNNAMVGIRGAPNKKSSNGILPNSA